MATYRLQLSSELNFDYVQKVASYLAELGVKTLYLSPILKARKASTHGYDGVDPSQIDPKFGSLADFAQLHAHALGLQRQGIAADPLDILLDIVPNHLAISRENSWWVDVLTWGQSSAYGEVFAIHWASPATGVGPVVNLPFLGDTYAALVAAGQLQLRYEDHRLWLQYYDHWYPVTPLSYPLVMEATRRSWGPRDEESPLAIYLKGLEGELARKVTQLHGRRDLVAQKELLEICQGFGPSGDTVGGPRSARSKTLAQAFDEHLRECLGSSRQQKLYLALYEQQFYRLLPWREGAQAINYRRFFDISDLIGIQVERPEVFDLTHHLSLDLLRYATALGLRVDHIDGLRYPKRYLERLAAAIEKRVGAGRPIWVEKILASNEFLPPQWPVAGSTGYDFLTALNALPVYLPGYAKIEAAYRQDCRVYKTREAILLQAKEWALTHLFTAEWQRLAEFMGEALLPLFPGTEVTAARIIAVFKQVTLHLPHYRTYIEGLPASPGDRQLLRNTLVHAFPEGREDPAVAWWHERFVDMGQLSSSALGGDALTVFFLDWQQLTGALMAKGFEDTFLYRYLPLSGLNEVGGKPWPAQDTVAVFHRHNQYTQAQWPQTINASSTHDCKRGEDVRARIHVLSEFAEEWLSCLASWQEHNHKYKSALHGSLAPDAVSENLLYQTLLGSYPGSEARQGQQGAEAYLQRIDAYMFKAIRERKEQSEWRQPDEALDIAQQRFLAQIWQDEIFQRTFQPLQAKLAYWGAWSSLSQLVLKCFAPGIPDIYQGCESWYLRLVDPDNREPVDFAALHYRWQQLHKASGEQGEAALLGRLINQWEDGDIKLYLTAKVLAIRSQFAALMASGTYKPLTIRHSLGEHVVGFERSFNGEHMLVVTGRWLGRLCTSAGFTAYDPQVWKDATLALPATCGQWRNILTSSLAPRQARQLTKPYEGQVSLREMFAPWPLAVLVAV